jgi:glycosyltransferase involved in cell wall biosynthesis
LAGEKISVVVIGRNEGERLARCLAAVARTAEPRPVEVIYVDSNSTDGSCERAAALGAKVLRVDNADPTAALGRNVGWTAALGELILFLDGDTELEKDFLGRAVKALSEDASAAVVWGHRREIAPEKSVYNRVLDLDWVFPVGESEFCGGDALMRRSALEEAGGYDASLIAGEEPDLCRRMRGRGRKILHIDAPMTLHDLNMTRFSQYWRRAVRAGYAFAQLAERYAGTDDALWARERRNTVVRVGFWLVTLAIAIGLCWTRARGWGIAEWCLLAAGACVRSAWRARWRGRTRNASAATLLMYGMHSQFQQLPILIGQRRYAADAKRNRRRGLIEYKGREGGGREG